MDRASSVRAAAAAFWIELLLSIATAGLWVAVAWDIHDAHPVQVDRRLGVGGTTEFPHAGDDTDVDAHPSPAAASRDSRGVSPPKASTPEASSLSHLT